MTHFFTWVILFFVSFFYFYSTQVYITRLFDLGFPEFILFCVIKICTYFYTNFKISFFTSIASIYLILMAFYIIFLFLIKKIILKKTNFLSKTFIFFLILIMFQITSVILPYFLISSFDLSLNYNCSEITNIKSFNRAYFIFSLRDNIKIPYLFSGIKYIIPWILIIIFNFSLFYLILCKNISLKKFKSIRINYIFWILLFLLIIQGIIPNIYFNISYSTDIFDFFIILISVFMEEFLFRFSAISLIFKNENFFLVNITQSILFCTFHVLKTNISFTLSLFFSGLIYGYIYKKYGLKYAITAHLIYNIITNIILYNLRYVILN